MTYYLRPTSVFLCAFCITIFYFKAKNQNNIPLPIKLYLLAYIISFTPIDIMILIENNINDRTILLRNFLDYIFTVIEFLLIIHYFYIVNNKKHQKKIITILSVLYITLSLLILVSTFIFNTQQEYSIVGLYTIQVLLLLIPTFFYFKNLLKDTENINIPHDPSFWISTGISFFLASTLVISIVELFFLIDDIELINTLRPIYYLFYIIMFLSFFKAYLCKPVIHQF